jgi:hypothetical protein
MEITMSITRLNLTAAARCAELIGRCRESAILQAMRKAGPYLLIELLLPGGTLMALLLYVYRSRRAALLAVA